MVKTTPFSRKTLVNMATELNQIAGSQVVPTDGSVHQLHDRVAQAMTCRASPANLADPTTCTENKPLATSEITAAMKRVGSNYPNRNFTYLGTVPLDFRTVIPHLAHVKINPTGTYGIVFNTDPSSRAGSHWITAFVDAPARLVCFFDSLGKPPPREVEEWIESICRRCRFSRVYNRFTHQIGNSECGVYAIRFIELKLMGKSCDAINRLKLRDYTMSSLRRKYGLDGL